MTLTTAALLSLALGATNPIIWSDVPDISIVRVGPTYYMSQTTMYFCPGLPIMASEDLVNWRLVSYAYETLGDHPALRLENGQNAYGAGTWASSLRYHEGVFYVSTFAGTTGRTYIYSTRDPERGPWQATSFAPSLHDSSLVFDDDGRVYMIHGVRALRLVELNESLTGLREGGVDQVIIEDVSAATGNTTGLAGEGSQVFRHNGWWYLFNITWPRGGMRSVVIHRARELTGPWEGRLALAVSGVAQGGLVDTPDGRWYAYLFQDHGAVGRVPWLVPVRWEDDWPVLDSAPRELPELPAGTGLSPGLVTADSFDRAPGEPALPLPWQWNHAPVPRYWSLSARPGWLRLTTSRLDDTLLTARNTLTQRTWGPTCWATVRLDASGLRVGDVAGLTLLQARYGLIGVRRGPAGYELIQQNQTADELISAPPVALAEPTVWLRAECDFDQHADRGRFAYSLDGTTWTPLGDELRMAYTLPHFTGYRFGLFCHATQTAGGWADFDDYEIGP